MKDKTSWLVIAALIVGLLLLIFSGFFSGGAEPVVPASLRPSNPVYVMLCELNDKQLPVHPLRWTHTIDLKSKSCVERLELQRMREHVVHYDQLTLTDSEAAGARTIVDRQSLLRLGCLMSAGEFRLENLRYDDASEELVAAPQHAGFLPKQEIVNRSEALVFHNVSNGVVVDFFKYYAFPQLLEVRISESGVQKLGCLNSLRKTRVGRLRLTDNAELVSLCSSLFKHRTLGELCLTQVPRQAGFNPKVFRHLIAKISGQVELDLHLFNKLVLCDSTPSTIQLSLLVLSGASISELQASMAQRQERGPCVRPRKVCVKKLVLVALEPAGAEEPLRQAFEAWLACHHVHIEAATIELAGAGK